MAGIGESREERDGSAAKARERERDRGETFGQTVNPTVTLAGTAARDSPFYEMKGEKIGNRSVSW